MLHCPVFRLLDDESAITPILACLPVVCKVRASNKRIVAAFSAHPAAPELLQICGWRTKVEELERYWTFDALPGSLGMG